MSTPANPQGQYEFSNDQNKTLIGLATSMRVVGLFQLILGMLYLVGCGLSFYRFVEHAPTIKELVLLVVVALSMFFFLTTGWWTMTAANGFRAAATTTGKDIDNVMRSLRSLDKLYSLLKWILIAIIILFLAGLGAIMYILYVPK